MNKREYEQLRGQIAGLDELLAMVPPEAVIDRMSLESFRAELSERLDAYPAPERWPETARLTFNGMPVSARRGIAADFGNRAVKGFADAVASVGASLHGGLSAKGQIRNRGNYSLMITGTATGSFGFEMEEDIERSRRAPGESPVESAIEQVNTIFKSLSGSDDSLAEAIKDIHPRAIGDLRDFLKLVLDNRATCSLAFRGDVFRFKDVEEVRRSLNRLDPQNIQEEDLILFGSFQGYLPDRRQAEFRQANTGEVILGKVDARVRDADAINEILGRPVEMTAHVRKVGEGRPRYTIMAYATT